MLPCLTKLRAMVCAEMTRRKGTGPSLFKARLIAPTTPASIPKEENVIRVDFLITSIAVARYSSIIGCSTSSRALAISPAITTLSGLNKFVAIEDGPAKIMVRKHANVVDRHFQGAGDGTQKLVRTGGICESPFKLWVARSSGAGRS